MCKYLIDVNLPYYFSLWNSKDFIHQRDINDEWSDEQIWNYAKKENMTIITKDADFSNKIIFHQPPPKIIHIRFGNMKMKNFYFTLKKYWDDIIEENRKYKLVNVFKDRIESIL